jgi:hypothetical protein
MTTTEKTYREAYKAAYDKSMAVAFDYVAIGRDPANAEVDAHEAADTATQAERAAFVAENEVASRAQTQRADDTASAAYDGIDGGIRMKNQAAVALVSLARGVKKTVTRAALAARQANAKLSKGRPVSGVSARTVDRIVAIHNALSIAGGMIGKHVIFHNDGTAQSVISSQLLDYLLNGDDRATLAQFRMQVSECRVSAQDVRESLEEHAKK